MQKAWGVNNINMNQSFLVQTCSWDLDSDPNRRHKSYHTHQDSHCLLRQFTAFWCDLLELTLLICYYESKYVIEKSDDEACLAMEMTVHRKESSIKNNKSDQ